MIEGKIWNHKGQNKKIAENLTRELGLSPLTSQILVNRGILTEQEAKKFLDPDLAYLEDPLKLPNMNQAVERILTALKDCERILIYGDYDVDGITGTALLVDFFKKQGLPVEYYIPERLEEGYGLNKDALLWAKKNLHCDLVITVDCGISGVEEVEAAKSYGLDMIITDHHEPGPEIPPAIAVVNPKLEGENCFQHLAGVGVAFKLVQALAMELDLPNTEIQNLLDLTALGTVADVVPLTGENRIIVKHGLAVLNQLNRPGLRALVEASGLQGIKLNTGHIAFGLAPRLNAAGRLGNASPAVELLLTSCKETASDLASRLTSENNKRQSVESQVFKEVCERIEREIDFTEDKVIVLGSPAWHSGVIGIVASKIVEKYYRPTILLSIEGEYAKGSGRSVRGFDLFKALQHCSDSLVKYGGHFYAAGLTVETDKINRFKNQLNNYATEHLSPDLLIAEEDFDLEVKLEELNFKFMEELKKLEPFGVGNPEPVFCSRKAHLENPRGVGKKANHLKCRVAGKNNVFDAIGFNLADQLEEKRTDFDDEVNILFSLQENNWNGNSNLQLNIKDINTSVPFKELFQLNLDFTRFWDNEIKKHFIIRVPLRKISAGLSFLLEDPLALKEIKLTRIDGQLNFAEENLCKRRELMLLTDPFYYKYEGTLVKDLAEIITYSELLDSQLGKEKIIDYRGMDKIKVLDELISQDDRLLVICNYKEKAEKLIHEILSKFSHLNCTSVISVFSKDDLYDLVLRQDEVQVVITNQLLETYRWFNYDIKVIMEPPLSLDEFSLRTVQFKNKPVILLWNNEDLIYNRSMLHALFPNLDMLNRFFELTVKNCKKGEPLPFNRLNKELALEDRNNLNVFLLAALKIFEELGIVSKRGRHFYLEAVNKDVEWEKSACFQEGVREKEAFKQLINSTFLKEESTEVI